MKKQTTPINIMVEKKLKTKATEVLDDLGLSMSMAITIYLKQIVKTNSIPFQIKGADVKKTTKKEK